MKQYERYDEGVSRSKLLPSRLCKQKSPMTVDRQMRSISTHVTLHHVNLPEQPGVPAIYAIACPAYQNVRFDTMENVEMTGLTHVTNNSMTK